MKEEDMTRNQQALSILLVDDSKYNCFLLQKYLRETPHQADIAENGQIAVEKFKLGSYKFVLMDMEMPVMDGYIATREIRKWEKEKGIKATPIIALTSSTLSEDIKKCLDVGCTVHLAKPIKKEKLIETIDRYARKEDTRGKEATQIGDSVKREKFIAYVEPELKELIPGFLENMHEEVKSIEETWNTLRKGNWDEGTSNVLARKAHKLAGSSGSFGFTDVSKAARNMEILVKSIIESGNLPTDEQRKQIIIFLEMMKQASLATIVYEENGGVAQKLDEQDVQIIPEDFPWQEEENRLIFLVEDDTFFSKYLAQQIGYFGYTVHIFTELTGLKEAVRQMLPAAVVMDIVFPEDNLAGTKIMREIQQTREKPIPVVFISARNDLTARLEAVRAGGDAYFTKPINVSETIERLDMMTLHKLPEPYRILIVEDDSSLANRYELILRKAGMSTTVVTNPMQVMKPLNEFRPDLILMDVYMPGCNGIELAAVIRQMEAYISIPIVFLSVEADLKKQLSAMSFGGDDFLTKPIKADHLVSVVTTRVQRARDLRSFIKQDSLTGLLNHTATLEQLEIEVARAKRRNTQLAFAMIDLDHFKSVNDTYGHLTGDRVLKSISRLLKKRLRKTDIIGRYGGEEFADILLDTDGSNAVKIMDEIRTNFAQVHHYSEGTEFTVTFSCGIASFPRYEDVTMLNDAADKALYEAKNSGRNRVVLANE